VYIFAGLAVSAAVFFFSFVSAEDSPSLMDSEIPLMDGANIINEKHYIGFGQVELETTAPSEDVTRFYNTVMQQKGWPTGKIMSGQGASVLTIQNHGDQFNLGATSKNGKTKVSIVLVQKTKLPNTKTQNTTVQKMAGNTLGKSPLKALKHQPENFPVNLPVADHRLEMTAPTITTDNTIDLDQPLVISFSQPMDPVFFDFEISPDKDNWAAQWSPDFDQVNLVPKVSPEPGQAVNLTATVLGGPEIRKTVTYRRLPPQRQLDYDLQNNSIDINQASRFRMYSLFDPSKVPEAYRLTQALPSGTPILNAVGKDFNRLNEKTREELRPYFLSPLDPESYWYPKPDKGGQSSRNGWPFSFFIESAWAEETPFPVRDVYTTENGHNLVIYGLEQHTEAVKLIHKLISTYRIYERFKDLLGRDVPFTDGTNTVNIFILDDMALNHGTYFRDKSKGGRHIINIASRICQQENLLGATLAHEIFHAFQTAFTDYLYDLCPWICESTATWSSDYIEKKWNTEQNYIQSAFEPYIFIMRRLNMETGTCPYGMYLFPYYLTEVELQDAYVIRRLLENCSGDNCKESDSAIAAMRDTLKGNFDDIWKKFCFATLDVEPKDKPVPDVVGEYGGTDPLEFKDYHNFKKIALNDSGSAHELLGLRGIHALYFNVVNPLEGPNAPAIKFNLEPFKKYQGKISIQSIIYYRDGRKEYEDWTGMNERLFCLSIDSQNFSEIYLVIGCSDHKLSPVMYAVPLYLHLDISPMPTSRCHSGSMVISRKFEEREIYESSRRIDIHTTATGSSSSSGNRWVTLFLDLALEEKIHDQQYSALDIMEERTKHIDPYEVKEVRNTLENMMKTTRASMDTETGLMKIRYRVISCRIDSAGGVYRSHSQGERTDANGIITQSEANSTRQWSPIGLDEKTIKRIDQGHVRAEIYFEPDTGKIIWVKVPQLDIKMQVTEESHGQSIRRAKDGYETTPISRNDTTEEEFQLIFSSDSKDKKDMPMDPVWKAKESDTLWATGEGRNERPVNRKKTENGNSSSTSGMAVETFLWSINLPRRNS
ncbi:MAG: hypothetical protein JW927_17975, partial [Deltaproteobacteria bacterium]|nr:hypothetical protein [Deltaproteobacteria bacterium]